MIYFTGDIHGGIDISKLSTKQFPQQKVLTKDDFVIICGDFGLVWDNYKEEMYWRKWLSKKNFTTLFVDGNHENFQLLRQFPLVDKFGGKAREIAPNVFHLERGYVFTIDGKKVFTMGGAQSHDKIYRVENISWWPEEIPNKDEMQRGIDSLEANGWVVDYVATHCAPRALLPLLSPSFENDEITSYLEFVRSRLEFKRWFFGHYHMDKKVNDQFYALYNNVVPAERCW